ncbi:unnamed protein product [Owenia fusiformis]|uniref:Solute carrier family 43 member 3 n=1 Tax=Owenia fusiformis TaxID=6347 RepID=A0A8S4Q634_OWEFU|nr:unnamed protein product [Owenia fusiformis]
MSGNGTWRYAVKFIWTLLECFFFSGILYGWTFLIPVLKENGFFSDFCNANVSIDSIELEQQDSVALHVNSNASNDRTTDRYSSIGKRSADDDRPECDDLLYYYDEEVKVYPKCDEQDIQLKLTGQIAVNVMFLLAFPLGYLFDQIGTLKVRVITISLFTAATLTMSFTSKDQPWLLYISTCCQATSGYLILLTNIQVSHVFPCRRYTVVGFYVGAFHASGLLLLFTKETFLDGMNIQSSFMFMTVSIIPMVINTVAILPKWHIPWPPSVNHCIFRGSIMSLQSPEGEPKESDRFRVKSGTEDSQVKKRVSALEARVLCSPLFIGHSGWFCLLYTVAMTTGSIMPYFLRRASGHRIVKGFRYVSEEKDILIQMLGLLVSPALGVMIDRGTSKCQNILEIKKKTQTNFIMASSFVLLLATSMGLFSLLPSIHIHYIIVVLNAILKPTLLTANMCFVTIFYSEGIFGSILGLTLFLGSIFSTLQYLIEHHVVRNLLFGDTFFVHVSLCLLSLTCLFHPWLIWKHTINPTNDVILSLQRLTNEEQQDLNPDAIVTVDESATEPRRHRAIEEA